MVDSSFAIYRKTSTVHIDESLSVAQPWKNLESANVYFSNKYDIKFEKKYHDLDKDKKEVLLKEFKDEKGFIERVYENGKVMKIFPKLKMSSIYPDGYQASLIFLFYRWRFSQMAMFFRSTQTTRNV